MGKGGLWPPVGKWGDCDPRKVQGSPHGEWGTGSCSLLTDAHRGSRNPARAPRVVWGVLGRQVTPKICGEGKRPSTGPGRDRAGRERGRSQRRRSRKQGDQSHEPPSSHHPVPATELRTPRGQRHPQTCPGGTQPGGTRKGSAGRGEGAAPGHGYCSSPVIHLLGAAPGWGKKKAIWGR